MDKVHTANDIRNLSSSYYNNLIFESKTAREKVRTDYSNTKYEVIPTGEADMHGRKYMVIEKKTTNKKYGYVNTEIGKVTLNPRFPRIY